MRENTLNPVDAIWLNADRGDNLMVIECLVMLDGPLDRARFERVVQERLVERFPVFSQRPLPPRGPGRRSRWREMSSFRLADHLHEVVLAPPGDDTALQEYVGRFLSEPLPRDRPLWQMHLIEGAGEGTAIYVRLHHALADGIALTQVLLSITDGAAGDGATGPGDEPGGEPTGRSTGRRTRVRDRLRAIGANVRIVTAIRTVLQGIRILYKLLFGGNPTTALSGPVGAAKKVVWSAPIPLARVKALSRATGTTVNDVLLAGLAGALHHYQVQHGDRPADLPTMVPVNLRPLDQPLPTGLGNRFAVVLLTLPAALSSPAARLHATHRRMESIKNSPEAPITFGLIHAIGLAGPRLGRFLVGFFAGKAGGVTTNVPGPREHRYLAGSRINGLLGWVPGQRQQTLGTCIFTYAGSVRVGFKVDAAVIPEPDRILTAFHAELEELFGLVGPPPVDTGRGTPAVPEASARTA